MYSSYRKLLDPTQRLSKTIIGKRGSRWKFLAHYTSPLSIIQFMWTIDHCRNAVSKEKSFLSWYQHCLHLSLLKEHTATLARQE